jgi:hypothetical protein
VRTGDIVPASEAPVGAVVRLLARDVVEILATPLFPSRHDEDGNPEYDLAP